MSSTWPDVVLAVLAGPLTVAGAAKLPARADSAGWPVQNGILAAPLGPRLVGGAELAAACALVLAPGRAAAAVAVIAYGLLAMAAESIRGRRCACFGSARLAAVGRGHVGGNLVGAFAAAAAFVGGPGVDPAPRVCGGLAAAVVTLGLVVTADRRQRGLPGPDPGCAGPVSAVRVYTTTDCPACRALTKVVAGLEPARRDTVHTIVLDEGAEPPEAIKDLGVPAAYGVDASGAQVCAAVSGIGAVKALIDTVTLGPSGRSAEAAHGR